MGKLLQMTLKDTLLNYVLNDIELRGVEHLYRRAAYHLDTLHYHCNNQWDTAADAEAFVTLTAFAKELSGIAKTRITEADAPELPEVVQ
jgi:hypothetical protein